MSIVAAWRHPDRHARPGPPLTGPAGPPSSAHAPSGALEATRGGGRPGGHRAWAGGRGPGPGAGVGPLTWLPAFLDWTVSRGAPPLPLRITVPALGLKDSVTLGRPRQSGQSQMRSREGERGTPQDLYDFQLSHHRKHCIRFSPVPMSRRRVPAVKSGWPEAFSPCYSVFLHNFAGKGIPATSAAQLLHMFHACRQVGARGLTPCNCARARKARVTRRQPGAERRERRLGVLCRSAIG